MLSFFGGVQPTPGPCMRPKIVEKVVPDSVSLQFTDGTGDLYQTYLWRCFMRPIEEIVIHNLDVCHNLKNASSPSFGGIWSMTPWGTFGY